MNLASVIEPFEEWAHLRHHHETPAATERPVTIASTTRGDTMQMSTIAADMKAAVANADDWMHAVLGTHLPAMLATVQRYENSPIVQALESAALPPGVEASIAATIAELAKQFPAPPQQPAQDPAQQPAPQPAQ